MKKQKTVSAITLSRETLRNLESHEGRQLVGGIPGTTAASFCCSFHRTCRGFTTC